MEALIEYPVDKVNQKLGVGFIDDIVECCKKSNRSLMNSIGYKKQHVVKYLIRNKYVSTGNINIRKEIKW